ncbi:neutral zinc metallopeptidase [Kangiella sp. TOML190]|uniref:KPN_02809 family neutral zinc metallopeptidase n=1 Tax=Kangiella sp. TOML190 TaxID=2931351 RepID=UPI00203B8E83|nr:neutral zinc metallopeptidase [Kangiella sp. TOML190]
MRWKDRRRSTNVDDRRGQSMKKGAAIGGGGIIMALIAIFLLGKDPAQVMQGMQQQQAQTPQQSKPYQSSPQEEAVKDFMSVVMADTEDTWGRIFQNAGQQYPPPTLVLYSGATQTACGVGQAASGPFYCPGDQDIYIDMAFLNELQRMGASGDFAVAYVLAHEVGHHIQTITGTSSKVRQRQARARSKAEANDLQVRMELQADCYAGVWANHTQQRTQFLERGDVEEAIKAAASVGDDTIMQRAGIPPRKENFTHGTSQQRMQWFNRGIQSGDIRQCDTGI